MSSQQLLERLVYRQQRPRDGRGRPSPARDAWSPATLGQRLSSILWLPPASAAAAGAGWLLWTEFLGCSSWASCTARGWPAWVALGVLAGFPVLLTLSSLVISLSPDTTQERLERCFRAKLVLWVLAGKCAVLALIIWGIKQLIQLAPPGG